MCFSNNNNNNNNNTYRQYLLLGFSVLCVKGALDESIDLSMSAESTHA